jgi:hypothetical protein
VSSINPLGFRFNLGRNASGGTNRIQLRDYSGVGFVVDTPANASTLTVTEATAASGGTSQALNGGASGSIPSYYSQTNGVWTLVTSGIAANVITVSGTPDLIYVWVPQGALSDGFNYVSASHSAKALTVITGDVDVARKVTNLRNLYA